MSLFLRFNRVYKKKISQKRKSHLAIFEEGNIVETCRGTS
ncbi:MAG: hypothetical protein ACD_71C00060G0002, partial [uncultured bacterium (gcode 4)]